MAARNDLTQQLPLLIATLAERLKKPQFVKAPGLFIRGNGDKKSARRIKDKLLKGKTEKLNKCTDPYTMGLVLRMALEDMIKPVISHDLYDCFMAAQGVPGLEARKESVRRALDMLAPLDALVWEYLCSLFYVVHQHCVVNKMDAFTISKVFSQYILRAPKAINGRKSKPKTKEQMEVELMKREQAITDMIIHYPFFFENKEIRSLSKRKCIDQMASAALDATARIVIDNGSAFVKIGVSGDDHPMCLIPSLVALKKGKKKGIVQCVGDAVYKNDITTSQLKYVLSPEQDKFNYDHVQAIWDLGMKNIKAEDMESRGVLLTELPDMSRVSSVKMMEIWFEEYGVPYMYIAQSALMTLYGLGRINGLVVDCGNRLQVMPVIRGYVNHNASVYQRNGIHQLTPYFKQLLTLKGVHYGETVGELEKVRKLKEELCRVSPKPLSSKPKLEHIKHVTSDGKTIELEEDRYQVGEALFDPSLLGVDVPGVHKQIYDVVKKSPIDERRMLLSNIVLSGGSTMFPGFGERLKEELWSLIKKDRTSTLQLRDIKFAKTGDQGNLGWYGGSVFSELDTFEDVCTWQSDYEEVGADNLVSYLYKPE